jgi:hypothetical protein
MRVSFFCLAKRKKPKKRLPHIKAYGFPQLLAKMSGCGTRPNKPLKTWLVAELKQSSPSSHFFCALRLAVRGLEVKNKPCE